MRKIWVFALFGLLCITTSAKAKVCFLPGIFGGDESCLSDSQYAECKGFEQTSPCPAGQEQITCTKNNKVYYHCYCRADTYNLIDHPEYRCKKGYTTECGCAAENLECAPEYIYEGDGMGHCKDYANTDGIGACVLPNGKVFYKDCECNKDKFPYSCRETGFKRPIDGDTRCEDPHGVELYSKCVCDENAGWSEFCENREDGCTQSKSQNTVGETTCSQCEEITCESDDFVNIEAYLCGASKTVTFDCETLGYIYAPAGVCPPGTGNAGKTGVKCPFDRNYMNCEELIACQNLTTCLQANEGATKCEEDPDVAGCYNVTECDEENGYYFDGQQCQISICPSGYNTSVKACVGDGYLFDTNGKSGGEDCAKCICEPSESCVYTPQKNDVSILSINGKSYKAVYAGNASVSGSCCNGYFKTCTSNCEGRKLVSDYDVNMEEYNLCEACGEKYYTITKCKDSFEIRNGECVASSCDTVNGFSTEVENGSQCKTASGLYEGALGWALELQKNALGEVVRSGGANCAKCVCSEPTTPSSATACRWSNFNKNINGYLKAEDLCCNGYYKNCYADFPAQATPEACNDIHAEQKDTYAACDYANACIIRSCKNGYTLENNKCVAAECALPYSSVVQNVSECGTGSGWKLNIAQDGNHTYIKSGELYCTQCQCNAATNCTWDESNKGTSNLTDLCCNGKYATCTSSCSGHLENNLVSGSGASVEQGVATRTECKACGMSYWTATSCKTDNGYKPTSDGRCERVGCPSGYTSGLTGCGAGFNFEAHTQTDNGEICGKCVAKTCADYEDYPLTECPTNWECVSAQKSIGSTTKPCFARKTCDDNHCGIDCAISVNLCNGYNLEAIENANMGTDVCMKRTGGGTNMCSEITPMYKTFTCKEGFKKDGNSCVAKTCADYTDYPFSECPAGYVCASASKKIGSASKTCYLPTGCDNTHCGDNCATSTNACTGYNLTAIANATMGTDKCEKVVGGGTDTCVKTTVYRTFTCNDGFKKNTQGTACIAKSCEDYEGWFTTCPANWTCTTESKKTGSTTTQCFKKNKCDASHCGTNCETATNSCPGYPHQAVAHATMSTNKCNKITGAGTNTCSAVTVMYEDFTCDNANGWKKNSTNTACIAKTCEDNTDGYKYASKSACTSANPGYDCVSASYTHGSVANTCWKTNGCDSTHCGTNCSTAATTCSGAYTSTISNATMTGECAETCSTKKTWTGFTCNTGYKKSGNTCTEKTCADNTDGYVYASESACISANPGRTCMSQSTYQLGNKANQTCWKVGGCDSSHCGSDCSIEATTCSGTYTSTIANATMTGECAETCSTKKTWTGFTCNTGWKKSGNTCAEKTCADNTDGYVYASESACISANPGKTCTSQSTYQLGANTNQTCWKVGAGCDSTHCGSDCSIVATTCSGAYTSTIANATMTGECAETCSDKKTWTGFTCNTGYKESNNTCTEKTCADNTDGYVYASESDCISANPGKTCTSQSTYQLGANTNQTCWQAAGDCDSNHCGEDCSTTLRTCSSNTYPYTNTANGKPAHSSVSGESCTPVSGSATCNEGETQYKNFICDSANGWKKNSASTACIAKTCADNTDGYTYDTKSACTSANSGYDCVSASYTLGSTASTCWKVGGCDSTHCGNNCSTTVDSCAGYNYPEVANQKARGENGRCTPVSRNDSGACSWGDPVWSTPPECESGYYWDETSKSCKAGCPSDKCWNASSSTCESYSNTGYGNHTPEYGVSQGWGPTKVSGSAHNGKDVNGNCYNLYDTLTCVDSACYQSGAPNNWLGTTGNAKCYYTTSDCSGAYTSAIANATMSGECSEKRKDSSGNCYTYTTYSGFTCNTGYHKSGTSCVANTCANPGDLLAAMFDGACPSSTCGTCTEKTITTPSGSATCHTVGFFNCSRAICTVSERILGEEPTCTVVDACPTPLPRFTVCYSDMVTIAPTNSSYTTLNVVTSDGTTCGTCYQKTTSGGGGTGTTCSSSSGSYETQAACVSANSSSLQSGETCTKVGNCWRAYCTKTLYSSMIDKAILMRWTLQSCSGSTQCRPRSDCLKNTGVSSSQDLDGKYHYYGSYSDGCLPLRPVGVSVGDTRTAKERCEDTLAYNQEFLDEWNNKCSNDISVIYYGGSASNNCSYCILGQNDALARCINPE